MTISDALHDRTATDHLGRMIAGNLEGAAPMTPRRLLWALPAVALTVVIVAQEGLGVAHELIDAAQQATPQLAQLPDGVVPVLALTAIVGLIGMAPRVHRRALDRMANLGFQA